MVYKKVDLFQLLTNGDNVQRIKEKLTEALKKAVYWHTTTIINWKTVVRSIVSELEMCENNTFLINHTTGKVLALSVPSSLSLSSATATQKKLELQLQETKTQSKMKFLPDCIVTCATLYSD